MSLTIVRLADVVPTPWRNGGGATRELLVWPNAAHWALRISVASIERDGPFSAFPGIERWFAVIDGAGVALSFADAEPTHTVRPGDETLRFDGGSAPACRLLGGATQDLNLMLARRHGRGQMQRLPSGGSTPPLQPFKAVYVADAAQLHRAGCRSQPEPVALPAGSLAWSDGTAGERWSLEVAPGTRAWSIGFEPEAAP